MVAGDYKGLQVTRDYRGLQGITRGYRGSPGVTRGYRGLKKTGFLTRTSPDTFS